MALAGKKAIGDLLKHKDEVASYVTSCLVSYAFELDLIPVDHA